MYGKAYSAWQFSLPQTEPYRQYSNGRHNRTYTYAYARAYYNTCMRSAQVYHIFSQKVDEIRETVDSESEIAYIAENSEFGTDQLPSTVQSECGPSSSSLSLFK